MTCDGRADAGQQENRTLDTPIGKTLRASTARRAGAAMIGVMFIGLDVLLVALKAGDPLRLCVGILAIVSLGYLAGWDRPTLGWRLKAAQGSRYWAKAALLMGGIILAAVVVAAGVYLAVVRDPRPLSSFRLFQEPSQFWRWGLHACLVAPVTEELFYRFTLCTAVAAVARPWVVIAASGVAFAGLHVLYGNPGVDNCLAGLLLAWAYLKSGSLLVPLLLHSAGNLAVGLIHMVMCYLP